MNFFKVSVVVFAVALFVLACNKAANTPVAGNAPSNANKPAATPTTSAPIEASGGKALFSASCKTCHQESGKGGKVTIDGKSIEPDDLTDAKMKAKSDDKLAQYITDGSPDDGMPAFGKRLKPEEIKAIVAHLRTLQGN
jgi:mono/diheme cytochrome c family protein